MKYHGIISITVTVTPVRYSETKNSIHPIVVDTHEINIQVDADNETEALKYINNKIQETKSEWYKQNSQNMMSNQNENLED